MTRDPILAAFGGPDEGPPGAAWLNFAADRLGSPMAAGLRAAGEDAPATPDDLWHFGSVGKPMTSAMIAALKASRVLDWDDLVTRFLPEVRETAYASATLRDLLSHRSGLPTDPDKLALIRYIAFGGDASRISDGMFRRVLRRAPAFSPGRDFLYSNVGYGLAGEIAARATSQSFDDLIRSHIFEPFVMPRARFGPPPQDGSAPLEHVRGPFRSGWKKVSHGRRFVDDLALIRPSGCVSGAVRDLAAFGQAHLQLRPAGSVLGDAIAETREPVGPCPVAGEQWRYAMGWFIDFAPNGDLRCWHAGSTGGSFALLMLLPERDRGLAVVANAFHPQWAQPGSRFLDMVSSVTSAQV